MIHYDLRAIEVIAGRWIDLMCSPRNHISMICGERTSALDSGILILQNLFLQFNDRVSFKWIEVEAEGTKRHKWDGVLQNVNDDDDKATVMLIEFAGGFGNQNAKKLENDTEKVYRNAARLLNRRDSNENCQPRIFIVLTQDRTIYFESLTLMTNLTYVRTRAAEIQVPYSPDGLKKTIKHMKDVFAWRDSVISSIQEDTASLRDANLDTNPIPGTP
ncbi:uncharacterized protein RHIMIDRAFT_107424 [Rhizopus microsporus ATCC 52813]|uniref:Uncharacterized protein n=2 Tax=Rhizopus microsporus TaxID=58291 RepID=A0A2G4T1L2_RHIZD|nr:uncharacterized protein RHIMIDRAFT_107424 [Rhizopus microsporus ATCC 52813]PHZ14891.1 hypothetical protein RHIMIDRAFT_107424 [Rhizopus microsporus ATCC 52813]